MDLRIARAGVVLALGLLLHPATTRAQALPQAIGEEVALGASISGVPCRLRKISETAQNGNETWNVLCDGWEGAAAQIWREPQRRWTPESIVAESPWAQRLTASTHLCEAAAARRLAGDIQAAVRTCRLRDGGWPTFVLGAQFAEKIHAASGVPDVLPQVESALALMAGRPVAAAAGSRQGLQEYNIRLLQETLGAGFGNVGLQDVSAMRNLRTLGIELNLLLDFVGSESVFRRLLEIQERIFGPAHPASAEAISYIALNLGRQGRFAEADAEFARAAPLIARFSDLGVAARDLAYRAGIRLQAGQNEEARRLADAAVAMVRERLGQSRGGNIAFVLFRAAQVYADSGDPAGGERLIREALSQYEGVFGTVHYWPARLRMALATVLLQLNRAREAEVEAREAVRLFEIVHGQRRTTAEAMMVHGDTLARLGRGDAALEQFRKGVRVALGDREARPQIRPSSFVRYLAVLLPEDGAVVGEGRADEAFTALQVPIDAVLGQSVTQMTARLASGDPRVRDLVRRYQETSRQATLLRASLGRAVGAEADGAAQRAPAQPHAQQQAQQQQAQLAEQVRAREAELGALERQLQSANPRYARLSAPMPVTAADTVRILRSGEAMLMTVTAQSSTWVVLVRDGKAYARRVPLGAAELQKRVDALRAGVEWARRGAAEYDLAAGHDLYRTLLGPLDARLEGVRHLVLVPGGALASLPPALLLRRPPAGRADYAAAGWLIQDMAVSVMPAVSSLQELREVAVPSSATQPFLGFGNPRFTGGVSLEQLGRACRPQDGRVDPALVRGLAPLPDTQDELRQIAAALKAPANAVVTGPAASLADLRKRDLSKVKILAFATHGLLPGDLPCQSEPALALTPGAKDDDGLLTASEIARLRLDADWVVLSACSTAAADGSARGGQALSGLVRAFLYAGSRAVLATHWDIASEPTVKLTTGTFRSYAGGDTGRAEALRQAQLAMIGDAATAHPVFWGAFVVVGEGGR